MSTLTPTHAHSPARVLADAAHVKVTDRTRALLINAALVLGGAMLVGALAQVSIPMWPVPITGQTLGVSLVGATLGARRGALSMLSYAALGFAGVPWFAGFTGGLAALTKPTLGYIVGFIVTAYVVGYFAERAWDRTAGRAFVMYLATSLIVFAFGVTYMWAFLAALGTPMTVGGALAAGFYPFIIGDIIKCAIAAGITPMAWKWVDSLK